MKTGQQNPPLLPRRLFLVSSAALVVAGCAMPYTAPEAALPASFDGETPPRPVTTGAWWQAFQDPQLEALLNAGRARNLSLRQAVAAIGEASAGSAAVGAGALPQVSIGAQGQRGNGEGLGPVTETSGGFGAVSWVLDLFGANRNAKLAAEARVDASWLSADMTRLMIEAAIASAYTDLRYHQAALSLTRRSLESRRKSLDLTRRQLELGVAGRMDLLQAEQLVAETEASLPAFEVGFDQALARLAALTAQTSQGLRPQLSKGAKQPQPRFKPAVGLPAEVIRNRPDVRLQERLYAAAAYEVGVAERNFLPSLSLSGQIAPTRISGGGSVTPWSFGPQINLPIFAGGALRANLRGAEARAAQAHLAWEAAVLKAVEEVETSLAAANRDARNVGAQQKLAATAAQAVELARTSYSLGEASFFNVLDAERSYLGAQQGLAAAERLRALNFISLGLAAAGGPGRPAN